MSLLITSQKTENSDKPYSYENQFDKLIIEKDSEIALIQSNINRSGLWNLGHRIRQLGVFFGNRLSFDDDDLKYTDTNNKVPVEKYEVLTKDIPWDVFIEPNIYNVDEFTRAIQLALNTYSPHPAFRNYVVSKVQSTEGEFQGYKIVANADLLDTYMGTSRPSIIDTNFYVNENGATYNESTGVITLNATTSGNSEYNTGLIFDTPIHPAGGKFEIQNIDCYSSNPNFKCMIGLCRNLDNGKKMPYTDNYNGKINYLFQEGSLGNAVDPNDWFLQDEPFEDLGNDFFDVVVAFNGTDVRLYYLDYPMTGKLKDQMIMTEIEYWNTATYGGSSQYTSVYQPASATEKVKFEIFNERIKITWGTKVLSDRQLPAIGSNQYTLYPKMIFKNQVSTSFTIPNTCLIVNNWDKTRDMYYNTYHNYQKHQDMNMAHYWSTLYVKGQIFAMVNSTDNVPAGLWIDNYRDSITTNTYDNSITLTKPNQMIILIAGDTRGDRYNYDGNMHGFLGFNRIEEEPDSITTTSITYKTQYGKTPVNKVGENLFCKISNLTMKSNNGYTHQFSNIIATIPRLDNNGNSVGLLNYEPTNLVFLDLKNKEDMVLSNIKVELVNINEQFVKDLEDYTQITFLIRKKQK